MSIANAPGTPQNFTFDTNIGFLAEDLTTPPALLNNVIQLYWNTEPVDPLLDHFEIVWRPFASQQWTHTLNVGTASQILLPISKDNAIFGLRAVGKNGKKSPATYALAVASQFF